MTDEHDPLDIVSHALCLVDRVEKFKDAARRFYYAVLLSGHGCPTCGGGLVMLREGACCCVACGQAFDPTIAFQRCAACGGSPSLVIRRYRCTRCGIDVPSRFLFDGLVFDAEYFRQKMIEYREGKADQRERVRQMLAESRSAILQTPAIELAGHLDLLQALDALIGDRDESVVFQPARPFDLNRYQTHIMAHVRLIPTRLAQIPSLCEDHRKDRVWRFIAILFLAHAGLVEIWQDGQDVMVKQREADPERQGVPGNLEENDGITGSVC
jgi:hypothetical protein